MDVGHEGLVYGAGISRTSCTHWSRSNHRHHVHLHILNFRGHPRRTSPSRRYCSVWLFETMVELSVTARAATGNLLLTESPSMRRTHRHAFAPLFHDLQNRRRQLQVSPAVEGEVGGRSLGGGGADTEDDMATAVVTASCEDHEHFRPFVQVAMSFRISSCTGREQQLMEVRACTATGP